MFFRKHRTKIRPSHRPSLETLEDRLAPATYTVSLNVSEGSGTLYQAIRDANQNPGPDKIAFEGIGEKVFLNKPLPTITDDVEILGPGAKLLTVQRNVDANDANAPDFSIFRIAPAATVLLRGLTMTQGRATQGGGVFNEGTLTVEECAITENAAIRSGGAIWNGSTSASGTPSLTLRNSTLNANSTVAGTGAGGIASTAGSITVINSTISGNHAVGSQGAGGIGIEGGTATVLSSTIVDNTGSGLSAGGVDAAGSLVSLRNTIIAGNRASRHPDTRGAFNSAGHNLIGQITENFLGVAPGVSGFGPTDFYGNSALPQDAGLEPLADNGGPTRTHAPRGGSPVIDKGDSTGSSMFDQRGSIRVTGRAIDIGAVEAFQTVNATQFVITGPDVINPEETLVLSILPQPFTSAAGPVTGVVRILEGATLLATLPLEQAVAHAALPNLSPGEHLLTFEYSGDDNYVDTRVGPLRYHVVAGAIWTGAANDGRLSTPANWRDGSLPAAGAGLIFPAAATGTRQLVNDLASSPTVVGDLFFAGNGYTLSGNPIQLTGKIVQASQSDWQHPNHNRVELGILLSGSESLIQILDRETTLELRGVLSGPSGPTLTDEGALVLAGANVYEGITTIKKGIVYLVNGSGLGSTAAGTIVHGGAVLRLQGATPTTPFIVDAEPLTLSDLGGGRGTLQVFGGDSIFNGLITLVDPAGIYIDVASLTVNGPITGPFSLRQLGGILRLTQPATQDGSILVEDGILEASFVRAPSPMNRTVVARNGGTVAALTLDGALVVMRGGIVSPGADRAGTIRPLEHLQLNGDSTYRVDVISTAPAGSGFDQVITNLATMEDAALEVVPDALHLPLDRESSFVIIDVQGEAPVRGHFRDLPEGAIFIVDGLRFRITYQGGTGNDVVLTLYGKQSDFPGEDQQFIINLYKDVLGRAPDVGGFNYFLVFVTSTQLPKFRDLATGLFLSEEHTALLIRETYTALLGRPANQIDLKYWPEWFRATQSIYAITDPLLVEIITSGEYGERQANRDADPDLAWLKGAYTDLLKRDLDQGGQTFWLNLLHSGISRRQVSQQLLASVEYRSNLINEYYATYLNRAASNGDRAYWLGQLQAGETREKVLLAIAGSEEAFQKSGPTQTSRVTFLYRNLVQRDPTVGDLQYGRGVLGDSVVWRNTAFAIVSSDEAHARLVRGWYTSYLGRAASAADVAYWVGQLAAGQTQQQVQAQILASAEYLSRAGGTNAAFLDKLYQDVLDREPDPGSQVFLDALTSGAATRQQVATIILTSTEAYNRLVDQYYVDYVGRHADADEQSYFTGYLQTTLTTEAVLAHILMAREFNAPHRS